MLPSHDWLTLKLSVKSTKESFLHKKIPANKTRVSEGIRQFSIIETPSDITDSGKAHHCLLKPFSDESGSAVFAR